MMYKIYNLYIQILRPFRTLDLLVVTYLWYVAHYKLGYGVRFRNKLPNFLFILSSCWKEANLGSIKLETL